jgi:hypothetical protein
MKEKAVNCFDCVAEGELVAAVGICAECGAGVCLRCVNLGRRETRHASGFSSAEASITETRVIACSPCAAVLTERHAGRYHFKRPVVRVRQFDRFGDGSTGLAPRLAGTSVEV